MILESVIKVLRPIRHGWMRQPPPQQLVREGYPIERWVTLNGQIQVLTAVEVATDKDGTSNGPEYHISVTRISMKAGVVQVGRIDTNDAKWVLAEFGLDGAEEDNHVPGGVARNFWRPVASGLVGKECKCKAEEVVIRENKGDYVWRP